MITKDSVCAYREFQRQAERAERQHCLALAQLAPDSPQARVHQRALYYVTAWKRWEQRRQRLDKKASRWLRQGWRDYWHRVWRDDMNA